MYPRAHSLASGGSHHTAQDELQLNSICRICLAHIRLWRVPPNWSQIDWLAEEQSVVTVALWRAVPEYSPDFQVPRATFLHGRGMTQGLTRYRQEWTYALRSACLGHHNPADDETTDHYLGAASSAPRPRAQAFQPQTRAEDPLPEWFEWLREAVESLPEPERRTVQLLFWDGYTEWEVAQAEGVSQQAISKRKRAALSSLRRHPALLP